MKENVLKWLDRAQRAHRAYGYYQNVKDRVVEAKEKVDPVVNDIKEGMHIGHGIGKVLNDKVTRADVKWAFRHAQNRILTRLERVVDETAKARTEKE